MNFINIKCDACGSEYKIPVDVNMINRERITCMTCSAPIEIKALVDDAISDPLAQNEFTEFTQLESKMKQAYDRKEPYEDLARDLVQRSNDHSLGNYLLALSALTEDLFVVGDMAQMFARNTYAQAFQTYSYRMVSLLGYFRRAYENSQSGKRELASRFGADMAEYAFALFQSKRGELSRTKIPPFELDFTQGIVCFLLPTIMETGEEFSDAVVDAFVENWNQSRPKNPIGKAMYAEIVKGFKYKLCYITTATTKAVGKGDDCRELSMLRDFRDNWLQHQQHGERLINHYYMMAPIIVKRIDRRGDAQTVYKGIWDDYLKVCIREIEQGRYESCQKTYMRMLKEMQQMVFN
ncbi:MAG: CFI-box-CTERM domain-containing protein [Christensenellales bacterium]